MDLFQFAEEESRESEAPLAHRMRPRNLYEVVGQKEAVGPGSPFRRALERDVLSSVILYGPPGTGKTSLAHVIAEGTKARFETLNAVTSGVADIRQVVQRAEDERVLHQKKTVLFIDEIHRFNKAQQDALLPHVEQGRIILVGATTENPYISVNPALVSRSHVVRLQALQPEDIQELLVRALKDSTRGLGRFDASVTDEALQLLVRYSGGDARRALNTLEMAVVTAPVGPDGRVEVSPEALELMMQQPAVVYDAGGDEHYDTISAFIKSIRGSDPDAALLWLAKMLEAGEDVRFIARRMMISASEDVGNANPYALTMATSALQAVQHIGMPEARIILGQVCVYLACAPKSNAAYNAINEAMTDVRNGIRLTVPTHLRGSSYVGAEKLGSGIGYVYSHDVPLAEDNQSFWPVGVEPRNYYRPKRSDVVVPPRTHQNTEE